MKIFTAFSRLLIVASALSFVAGLLVMTIGPVWAAVWFSMSAALGSWVVCLLIAEIQMNIAVSRKINSELDKGSAK